MYNFDRDFDRRNTEVIKWDRRVEELHSDDVLPFGIADMDFEVLPELRGAMIRRAEHPTYGYTFPAEDYYQSFLDWTLARHQLRIKKEEFISVPGIVCATSFVIHALTKPGDKVMLCTPVYDPFFQVIRQQGREQVNTSLCWDGTGYRLDFSDFEEKLKSGVKLFILCSPHNPVGRVWSREELEKIADLCHQYGVYVFSDEIHCDLVYPGHRHIPFLSVSPKAEEMGLLAMAPSKTFNVAGLKCSMLVAKNPEILSCVNQTLQTFHVGVNLFGLKAAQVAYRHGAAWVDELLAYLLENAKLVADFVERRLPGVKTFVPEGTYLMWLDFRHYGLSQQALMDKLVLEAKVGLNDGSHYGDEGVGFARMNIATQRGMLLQGLERMERCFCS